MGQDAGMVTQPSGTVTMLFSDIEGSTALLSRLGDRYVEALDAQRAILRAAWSRWGGVEMGTEGDSFFVVFDVASDAASAALQAQLDLATHAWPQGERVAVRMGLHTGEPAAHGDGYVGMDVHRAARLASTAHGGQVVVSEATGLLVSGALGDDVRLLDLGHHRLKDIDALEHVFQLCAPDLPADFPPLKSLGTTTNLPRSTTPMVGREAELGELLALSASPDVRLVTLTGPGGSGKTRLGVAVAAALGPTYRDGAYFVPLAAVTSGDAMWASVAEVLGAAGEDRARPQFLHWVRTLRALLVLDNLEHLPGSPTIVGELLDAAEGLDVITTSRRPMHLHGEQEYPVPPLALPKDGGFDQAQRSEAVLLFCQHAALARRGFALTVDNEGDVVALCQRLDGMPLAIELAAARVKLLSPSALLARMDDTTDLAGRHVDRPERQQTLRAAIGWSYDLLPADLQGFFRGLGVFAGGADLDAVGAVSRPDSDVLDAVAELVDASLVGVGDDADGEPRVRMLQTIRDFALERLADAGEGNSTRRLHADYYASLVERLAEEMQHRPVSGRDRFDLEQDNIRAALSWTVGAADATVPSPQQLALGVRICLVMFAYWEKGHAAEARFWHERLLELSGDVDSKNLADLRLSLGALLHVSGDYDASIDALNQALAMARRVGAERTVLFALVMLGEVHVYLGNTEVARNLLNEGLSLARDASDAPRISLALAYLGWLEYLADDTDRAMTRLMEAEEIFRSRHHGAWLASIALMEAAVQLAAGDLEDASRRLHALATDPVLRADSEDMCTVLDQFALLAAAKGHLVPAARLAGAAAELRVQEGVPFPPAEQKHLSRHLAASRAALGTPGWEEAYRAGAGLTLDDALAEAKALHSGPAPAESSP